MYRVIGLTNDGVVEVIKSDRKLSIRPTVDEYTIVETYLAPDNKELTRYVAFANKMAFTYIKVVKDE